MDSSSSPAAVRIHVKITAAAIPTAKPRTRVPSAWVARRGRPLTMPTQNATSGPNSGPTTMAPTMRIGWSSMTPIAAIMVATIMKQR